MKHIGLFEGIGGFSLAARWMSWETIAWCEKEPFCRQVLSHHFPNADKLEDIYNEDFTKYKGKADIVTGGFPCQPFSVAGRGKGTADDRFLWGQMLRAITEISPMWVVAENVRGLLSSESGTVFETVCSDLENTGYEVLTFIIPAASVNAPHKRERVWIVAYRPDSGFEGMRERTVSVFENRFTSDSNCKQWDAMPSGTSKERKKSKSPRICDSRKSIATNTSSERQRGEGDRTRRPGLIDETCEKNNWENFPTQSPVCDGDDGVSSRLDIAAILKVINRKVNKLFNPFSWWRKESIKSGGNAIVPNVAYELFICIDEINKAKDR